MLRAFGNYAKSVIPALARGATMFVAALRIEINALMNFSLDLVSPLTKVQ
jgi:hypothetical protein